jgi:hypothetical protein
MYNATEDVFTNPGYEDIIHETLVVLAVLLFASASDYASPPKPCEELKTEIAAKLDAKNVKGYTLTIVDKDKEGEGTVVGSCDGGSKKILYLKK